MARTEIKGTQIKDESIESADIASGSIKKGEMSPQAVSSQAAITSVDTTNDMLLIFDATDSALKKVAPTDLGIGSPAGSDKQIQYNNGGAFGGAAALVYDDGNGYLGIGSVTPSFPLHVTSSHVNTAAILAEGNGITIKSGSHSSYGSSLKFMNPGYSHATMGVSGSAFVIAETSTNNGQWSGATPLLTVGLGADATGGGSGPTQGYIGIGTANPAALLHISSSIPGVLFRIDHPDSGIDNPIFFVTGSAGQSKIGIGTDTPDATFAISDDGKVFEVGSAGETSWLEVNNGVVSFNQGGGYAMSGGDFLGQRFNIAPINATYGALGIGKYPGATVNIIEVNSENSDLAGDYFVIDSDGKVGISTISPSTLLDVSGSAKANTFVTTPYLTDLGSATATHLTSSNGVHFLDADSVTLGSGKSYHELYLAPGSTNGQHIQLTITGSANNPVRIVGSTGGAKATGTITSTGVAANGQSIVLKGPGGSTSYTISALDDAGLPCGSAGRIDATTYLVGINGCTSAAQGAAGIYTAIETAISNDSWPFTLGAFTLGASTVISLTATAAGTASNQTTTENMDNTTVLGFSGGSALATGTLNSTYGVALAGTSASGGLIQGAHLIYDSNSEQWQIIAGTQLTS